jgi:hypothetical protein
MRTMATGRPTRESQVRRRPPSTGRPAPVRGRPRAPIAGSAWRTPPTRRAEPRSGFTIVVKILLGFAVIAFSAAIILAGTGILSRAVSGIGTSLAGFIGQTEPPSAAPSAVPLPDAPVFAMPGITSTADDTIDLSGSVPASVAGRSGYTVVVSGGLRGEAPEDLASVPVGPTTVFGVEKVPLKVGVNVLTARIQGPAGDSPEGPQILVIVDRKPPSVKITSPEDGATVNGSAARVIGKTQGSSNLLVRNETTGQRISGLAKSDGTFELAVGIAAGRNTISLQATDPAGNVTTKTFTVVGGTGKLKASLAASARKIAVGSLPSKMTFTAIVLDPDGKRLPGATVTFSVSVPGIPTLTKDVETGSGGKAVYSVTIPQGATAGSALATALVTTETNGDTSAQLTFTIVD